MQTPASQTIVRNASNLSKFVREAHRCFNDRALYSLVAQSLYQLLPADRRSVTILDQTGDKLKIYGLCGTAGLLPAGRSITVANSSAGVTIRQKQPKIIDYAQSAHLEDCALLIEMGMDNGMCAPIIIDDSPIGTINIASAKTYHYTPDDLCAFEIIASTISACLQKESTTREFIAGGASNWTAADYLQKIAHASLDISQAENFTQVLDVFQQTVFTLFPFEHIVLAALNEADGAFQIQHYFSRENTEVTATPSIDNDSILAGEMPGGNIQFILDKRQFVLSHGDDSAAATSCECIIPVHGDCGRSEFIICASSVSPATIGYRQDLLEFIANIVRIARQRIDASAKIKHQLHHDALTSLYNRDYFNRALDKYADCCDGRRTALILTDLDKFKEVNDSFGHLSGDATLIKIGHWLAETAGEDAICARLGGDEFAILLPLPDDDRDYLDALLQRLRDADVKIRLDGKLIDVGFSAGVAVYPDDARSKTELLRFADLAMYTAKAHPLQKVFRFVPDMTTKYDNSRQLISEFKQALRSGQIIPHYQMLVNLNTGKVEGLEALARWRHPEKGLLSPGAFNDVFSNPDLTDKLARRMFQCVADDIVSWRANGVPYESVGINIEISDQSNRDLFAALKDVLAARAIPMRDIAIEVTENAGLAETGDEAIALLEEMRAHGMYIALNDFGVGHSSLTNLKRMPLTAIKLDRIFVRDILSTSKDRAIASSVIELAAKLGIVVVAEGVETIEHMIALKALNCQLAQGHLFSQAIPADAIAAKIAAQNRTMASSGREQTEIPVALQA